MVYIYITKKLTNHKFSIQKSITLLAVYLSPSDEAESISTDLPPVIIKPTSAPPTGSPVTNSPTHSPINDKFPDDFLFGSASAAYQIEGAWNADGKGENIWDRMTHSRPELIAGNLKNGDFSANSYELYKEDVKALKMIGVIKLNYVVINLC